MPVTLIRNGTLFDGTGADPVPDGAGPGRPGWLLAGQTVLGREQCLADVPVVGHGRASNLSSPASRSAVRARAVVLLTVPSGQPRAAAVSASDRSSR